MAVDGVRRVLRALEKARRRYGNLGPAVVIGYTAQYAIYVHENLAAAHKPPAQAKFLEAPARAMQPQLAAFIRQQMKRGVKEEKALLAAGLMLQGASQRICPVDTGALSASAFTRLEGKGA